MNKLQDTLDGYYKNCAQQFRDWKDAYATVLDATVEAALKEAGDLDDPSPEEQGRGVPLPQLGQSSLCAEPAVPEVEGASQMISRMCRIFLENCLTVATSSS